MITGQGAMETTPAGALRESNKHRGRFDLLPYEAIEELAIWYELGAEKYEPRNWEKGLSVSDCINRMVRHALKAASGWMDENHLAAVMWNAAGAITMMRRRPDLNDHRWIVHEMDPNGQEYLYSAKDVEMTQKLVSEFAAADEIHETQNKPIEEPRTNSRLIDKLHEYQNKTFAESLKKQELEKMVQGFSESLQRGHASAMGITVEEYREMMLGKGKHQDSMARAQSQLNAEKDQISEAESREEELFSNHLAAVEAIARDKEQATLEKILRMFYDVTHLDIRDREYLGRCIGDGRVQSLDSIEQFLNKIQGG